MAQNFTPKHFQQHPKASSESELSLKMKQNLSPSSATIRNLLNYSKALVIVPDSISTKYSFILLN